MGCDIHLQIEKKVNGKWQPALAKRVTKDSNGDERFEYPEPYDSRCYDMFAILANVRNGSGFAGEGFVPISAPKGMPADLSEEYNEDTFWFGDHSHSYLTLSELLKFDYRQKSTKVGWVSWPVYVAWKQEADNWGKENCYPKNWSGGVDGPSINHVEIGVFQQRYGQLCRDEMWDLIREANKGQLGIVHEYAQLKWSVTYAQVAQRFASRVTLLMTSIAYEEGLNYKNIRIVFGFDS